MLGVKKFVKNKPFGSDAAEKFSVGDFVYWIQLIEGVDVKSYKRKTYGILLNIVRKQLGEREVVFAKVLPLKTNIPDPIPSYSSYSNKNNIKSKKK